MNTFKSWIFAMTFAVLAAGSVVAVIDTTSVSAVPQTAADCSRGILTFPTWFRGVVKVENGECVIMSPSEFDSSGKKDGLSNFIWRIVLNVIEIGLQIAGYVAVFYILYGGFQFLTSQGSPEGSTKARKTILNAVIGLVISIGSVAIVNLITGVLG